MRAYNVTCATCGCDTGATNFLSVQRRLNDNTTPVWREGSCRKTDCTCHLTPEQFANRTAAGLPTTITFKVRAT